MIVNYAYIICIFLFGLPLRSGSQGTLKVLQGMVAELNSGSKPLSPVQVKSDFSTYIYNNLDGTFKLKLDHGNPGSMVKIKLEYKNFIVVNERELNVRISNQALYDTLKFYMSTSAALTASRLKYYNISTASIKKNYDLQISRLNKSASDYAAKYQELETGYNTLLQRADALAERYSRINFDDISYIEKQAFDKYQIGEIHEAIKLLEGINSTERIQMALSEKEKAGAVLKEQLVRVSHAKKVIRDEINKLLFQGDLYQFAFRWNDAEQAYREAASADTTNTDATEIFAFYLKGQKKYENALKWYRTVLNNSSNALDSANAMNSMAAIYQVLKLFDLSEQNYLKALKIFKKYPAEKYKTVAVHANLGTMYLDQRDYVQAESTLMEGYAIYGDGDLDSLDSREKHVLASLYSDIGELFEEINEPETALMAITVSVQIREKLMLEDPASDLNFLASSYQKQGTLLLQGFEFGKAKECLDRAIFIYDTTRTNSSPTWTSGVASVYSLYGALFEKRGDFGKSETYHTRAVEMYEKLLELSPSEFITNLLAAYSEFGNLYISYNKIDKAKAIFTKQLQTISKISKTQDLELNEQLANVYNNFSSICVREENYDGAEAAIKAAIEHDLKIYEINPVGYSDEIATDYNNLAAIFFLKNEYDSALTYFNMACERFKLLAEKHPKKYEPELAKNYVNISALYKFSNRIAQAKPYLELALRLFKKYSDIFKREIDMLEEELKKNPD